MALEKEIGGFNLFAVSHKSNIIYEIYLISRMFFHYLCDTNRATEPITLNSCVGSVFFNEIR